jgi:UDP-GlcNAc:undecaprenyl-phosphate GlcNAc-1-phosphate transferase
VTAATAGDLLHTGGVAAGVSLVATAASAWLARRLGALDRPGGYKAHAAPTPLLGGLGVAAGAVAGVGWGAVGFAAHEMAGLSAVGAGAALMVAAGLVDDLRGLAPRSKLVSQLGAAAVAGALLALLGVRLQLFLDWPLPAAALLTVLWVVAITNALNFLDNMDGLCAGLGAIGAAALAAVNLRTGESAVAVAAAALAGACLGFLPHNWPRARVFLGDAGSMAIGFGLAGLSVLGVYTPGADTPKLAVTVPLVVLAVPALDLVLVVWLRLRSGRPPWLADRRHLSHRLVRRGLRPTAAVAALWATAAACGVAALVLPVLAPAEASILLAGLACLLGGLAVAAGTRGLP